MTIHVGVMVPSLNTVIEREWHDLAPAGVHVHLERIHVTQTEVSDDDGFATLYGQVTGGMAQSLSRLEECRPDRIVLGMVSVFYGGAGGSKALVEDLQRRTDIELIAASHAIVTALREMGVERVGILNPYQRLDDGQVERFFVESGFDLTGISGLPDDSIRGIPRTPVEDLVACLLRLAETGPQAIVQVGANLGIVDLLDPAEAWLDIPVLSSNATGLWAALRSCGRSDQLRGGRLWRDH
ncbi:Asp/Glu racemase [Parafrankia sp. EAN1pec]|uniref:maleate cis-trans isomerase family protein n=1 Tax=Parafrankia sp. (strain EAN1pec) TaxID=298653 RepID=UPI00005426A5|nr:Asp/Glu racemase [Frankia sp. EAN1pec]